MPTGPLFQPRMPDDPGVDPIQPGKEPTMFGNYSKLVGSAVGAIFGILVSKFALPAEYASPEIQASVTVLLTAVVTYLFPANKPSA